MPSLSCVQGESLNTKGKCWSQDIKCTRKKQESISSKGIVLTQRNCIRSQINPPAYLLMGIQKWVRKLNMVGFPTQRYLWSILRYIIFCLSQKTFSLCSEMTLNVLQRIPLQSNTCYQHNHLINVSFTNGQITCDNVSLNFFEVNIWDSYSLKIA